ncbi:hypothetical protein [Deinococcus marmoris]|uniref:hypothetical protein n=1 Tax=Deinococcus marmoris TaxID=249408 RepID=UPI0012DE5A79|nr:hypothetical protein [Deinococcus marmoris]
MKLGIASLMANGKRFSASLMASGKAMQWVSWQTATVSIKMAKRPKNAVFQSQVKWQTTAKVPSARALERAEWAFASTAVGLGRPFLGPHGAGDFCRAG